MFNASVVLFIYIILQHIDDICIELRLFFSPCYLWNVSAHFNGMPISSLLCLIPVLSEVMHASKTDIAHRLR